MSIIPAQINFADIPAVHAAPVRRLPRAIGWGLAALASGGLWSGLVIIIHRIF